jgi:ABC-type antimicrobial peptide transport system permease subunit
MAIFERTREFGVLTAMGMTKNRLTKLLLTESMIMTVIGVAVGMAVGVAVTLILGVVGMDFGGEEILRQYGISGKLYPRLTPASVTVGPIAVLAVTFLAALYPALKIRRLKPVEALAYV